MYEHDRKAPHNHPHLSTHPPTHSVTASSREAIPHQRAPFSSSSPLSLLQQGGTASRQSQIRHILRQPLHVLLDANQNAADVLNGNRSRQWLLELKALTRVTVL